MNSTKRRAQGVQGFPTIKHGDTSAMEDYRGGRDFDALDKFAAEMRPVCSVHNLDNCAAEDRAQMDAWIGMDMEKLKGEVEALQQKEKDAEELIKQRSKELQAIWETYMADKKATDEEVAEAGLKKMQAVLKFREANAVEEEKDGERCEEEEKEEL